MQIDYTHRFIKLFRKTSKEIQKQTRNRVDLFRVDKFNPLLNNHALQGNNAGYRSININGDWRAVFRELGGETVSFEDLGTHSQLYGK